MNVSAADSPGDFLANFDLQCPYCDFSSQNQSQLTRHIRTAHKVLKQKYSFVPLRDAASGRPQCTHCRAKLANRGGLQRHIVQNHRLHFGEHRPLQACLADHPQLRAIAASADWHRLWQDEDLLGQLCLNCSLCGLQYDSRKGMVEHLQLCVGSCSTFRGPVSCPDKDQSMSGMWT